MIRLTDEQIQKIVYKEIENHRWERIELVGFYEGCEVYTQIEYDCSIGYYIRAFN